MGFQFCSQVGLLVEIELGCCQLDCRAGLPLELLTEPGLELGVNIEAMFNIKCCYD